MAEATLRSDPGDAGQDACRVVLDAERALHANPGSAPAWFALARALRAADRNTDAWRADIAGVRAAAKDRQLLEAALAMNERRFEDGEALLHGRLAEAPDDPVATRLLGEMRWRQGDITEAIVMVERAVALAPGFDLAREFLIRLLLQANRLVEARAQADRLAASPFRHPGHDMLRASVMVGVGEQAEARDLYSNLLRVQPNQPQVWQNFGHVLKTLGEQAEAVAAYRQAVTLRPAMGEAWWSLANLKTVKLCADDVARMERALVALGPDDADAEHAREDRFHLHFALGKALEDAGDYGASFAHYARGNWLRRTLLQWDAKGFSAEIRAACLTFDAPFLAACGPGGCPTTDPIFIVGLPRSGSTLVEHILASHSKVEGTMELPDMMMIAGRLRARVDEGEFSGLAALLTSLGPDGRRRLGEEYLERTRVHRRTDRPFFIDKMPNNWENVGLIRLLLPNARIIDARRHPIGCCFSAWKQHFARGQAFSYDLTDIGSYYRDYLALMSAFDAAAPGAVHRVIYEDMVADTRGEVTRLLDYLALPFEEECLSFWQTKRPVRTASSEQVRKPIFTDGVEHWRHFQAHLEPLVAALGNAESAYVG